MSLYKEKEDKFAEAFAHLIEDSSSDEFDDKESILSPKPQNNSIELEEELHSSQPEATQLSDTVIDVLDDNDDCIILDDEVEVISSNAPEPLVTRQKKYIRSPLEKPRYSSPIISTPNIDLSFNDDYEFNLKIILAGTYRQFRTTYNTKLSDSLASLLEEIKSRRKTLWLTFEDDDKCISLDESPRSLSLTPGSILNAIEISSDTSENKSKGPGPTEIGPEEVDPDILKVKLQDGHRKHMKEFEINRNEAILKLKELWSKEYNIDVGAIKLCFDGDVLTNDSTPEEADIDDGCVLDVMVTQ